MITIPIWLFCILIFFAGGGVTAFILLFIESMN